MEDNELESWITLFMVACIVFFATVAIKNIAMKRASRLSEKCIKMHGNPKIIHNGRMECRRNGRIIFRSNERGVYIGETNDE